MTTQTIAPDRFRFRVDLLPGETVLWEGGAQSASAWPRRITIGLVALALAVVFSLPALFGWLDAVSRDAKSRIEAPATAADSRANDKKTERAPMTDAERAEYVRRAKRHFLMVFGVLLPIGLAILYADTRARQRNAWYVVTSERVCMQGGALTLRLSTIDLDRIVSVQASATWLERRFGVETIELGHAGVNVFTQGQRVLGTSTFAMAGVARGSQVLTHLLGEWLPRDGRRKTASGAA